jgi:glutamate-ammonia-ligase adenylyltransferase
MGKCGGLELNYVSDVDVIFVCAGDEDLAEAQVVAARMMQICGQAAWPVDANLRPEGTRGPLVRTLASHLAYYRKWARTWEFQALLKARPVAGDAELGARFAALVEPFVFRDPFPDRAVREVRRMKARIERERIPPGEDPEFHLKLGRGSLSDVEFTVQLLQLRHGATHPEVRATSTIDALHRLRDAALLDPEDADALEASYRFCERARNAHYLLTGRAGDSLPTDAAAARTLGRLLGYLHRPQAALRDDYRRVTRRARRVVDHLFYGRS